MEAATVGRNNLADLSIVRIIAIGREAHDFAFVAILRISDELAEHRIQTAERVRHKYAFKNLDVIAFTVRHHRGDKIPRTVIAETGSLLPGRAVVCAGDVGDVMFEMVFLKFKLLRADVESRGQQRAYVAHRLFALPQTDKVQNLRRITDRILNFPDQIGVAVLTDRHMLDVRDLRPNCIQTGFYGQSRKSPKVFASVEPLFRNGKLKFTVEHDGCGGEIGRASCRERVEISGGGGSLKKKKKSDDKRTR